MEVNVSRKWCPGRVMRENRNGTFYVELDDGDDPDNVKEDSIRASASTKSAAPAVFKLSSQVVVSLTRNGVITWYERVAIQASI